MNILVVDDHEEMRAMLSDALEDAGHRALTAAHGSGALAALVEGGVELVISDMLMPDVDGLEFLVKIHQMHLPVIAMSGLDRDYLLSELLARLGVCAFLQKPFSIGRLVAMVNRLAEKSALEVAVAAP
jgi:DNA-binding NtrC family response regulator